MKEKLEKDKTDFVMLGNGNIDFLRADFTLADMQEGMNKLIETSKNEKHIEAFIEAGNCMQEIRESIASTYFKNLDEMWNIATGQKEEKTGDKE